MGEYKVDRRDIRFVLFELLDLDSLLALDEFKDFSREDFEIVLDEGHKFAENIIAPINQIMDEKGCRLEGGQVILPEEMLRVYQAFAEAGWIGMSHNPEYGGQGFPEVVAMSVMEGFIGGCCTFTLTPMLTRGAAHVIENHGEQWMKDLYCEKMYTGQWAGTMCLTEAQAGSDVGATRCQAKREGDHYLLEGTKIFITSGEHNLTENIIHLVLARLPDSPPGTSGISLFLVPKHRVNPDGSLGEFNDVRCGSIEHKMGIKGSATCELVFGQDGDCHAWLVGEPHKGMRLMFQLMNAARLEVGQQGQSLGAGAYHLALEYAKERLQGPDILQMRDKAAPKVPIVNHPDVRRMLVTMKAYVEGLRAMMLSVGYYVDMARCHPDEKTRDRYQGLVELLTPICKAYGADMGFKVCDLAIMVHGGYGFCTDYGVEQYLRDCKIAAIYEGSNGIQSLDLMGRKLTMKKGAVFMGFVLMLNQFIEKHRKHPRLAPSIKRFENAKNLVAEIGMFLGSTARKGLVKEALQFSYPYLENFGDMVTAWYLIQGALVADDKLQALYAEQGADTPEAQAELIERHDDARFYAAKLHTVDFFTSWILPNVAARAETMKSLNPACLAIPL
ncbi:MAG: acyl-CoA dehydrogenase [Bradymonadales bacterium]|nr:acyl-CoA dehydrogenase [Bradymonadales bacterium]